MASANVVQTSVSGGNQNALALQGDGVFFPKVSTASRLALALGTSDSGFIVYDTQVGNLFFWTGTAWTGVPTSGSPGLNQQVQYNNNGVVQGATGFTFDNATNAVAMSGDLTVRTNVISATSSGVGFGINTAAAAIDVVSSFQWRSNTGGTDKLAIFSGGAGLIYLGSTTASALSFLYNGSEAMRLNATGLGVGAAPAQKLTVAGSAEITGGVVGQGALIGRDGSSGGGNYGSNTGNTSLNAPAGGSVRFNVNNGVFAGVFDANANLGIGVTPSAWLGFKALQVQYACFASNRFGAGNIQTFIGSNAFYDGSGYKYIVSDTAARYALNDNVHAWYNAPFGTAGTAITFTQAMTLDASGNLLVGKTAASATTIGFQTLANGEASVAMAASTSASSTLNVWSTGAAAFRFYVAMNGTISATNTTISAISDARLKENVQDIDVGLGAILALKPRKFDWKAGKGKDIKGDRGFIAQEFEQVFPQLVDEWKDPAPEGEAPYKSVRQDLIPVLVKAIQELTARVQTLETR